jgi:hypothetical protein
MKSEAYLEGRKAVATRKSCPYAKGTRQETDWLLGQYDAKFGVIPMDEWEPELEEEYC